MAADEPYLLPCEDTASLIFILFLILFPTSPFPVTFLILLLGPTPVLFTTPRP